MQGPFINRQTFWQRVKQLLAPVVVVLKVGWPFFKMSGFMLISLFFRDISARARCGSTR